MKTLKSTILATAATVGCLAAGPLPDPGANDALTPGAPGAVRIEGWLEQRMASNLAHHVMTQNMDRIIQPFRDRQEESSGHWRCFPDRNGTYRLEFTHETTITLSWPPAGRTLGGSTCPGA